MENVWGIIPVDQLKILIQRMVRIKKKVGEKISAGKFGEIFECWNLIIWDDDRLKSDNQK